MNKMRVLAAATTVGCVLIVGVVIVTMPSGTDRRADLLRLGPYSIVFPPGYVASYHPHDDADQPSDSAAALSFVAKLPDLEPRTQQNAAAFSVVGFGDILRAYLFYHGPQLTGDALLSLFKSKEVHSQWFPQRWEHEFTISRINMAPFFYLYEAESDTNFFMVCSDDEPGTSPYCEVTEAIGPDLVLAYSFSKQYAPEALAIDAKLRSFLQRKLWFQPAAADRRAAR